MTQGQRRAQGRKKRAFEGRLGDTERRRRNVLYKQRQRRNQAVDHDLAGDRARYAKEHAERERRKAAAQQVDSPKQEIIQARSPCPQRGNFF